MGNFDPVRAQREIVMGLTGIYQLLQAQSTKAQQTLGEAEASANALMKLERFAYAQLQEERNKLHKLEVQP